MAQDDTNLKVVPPGPDAGDDTDDARARSLQLGSSGGVPGGQIFGKYLKFLGDVRDEMRRVTWPTRKMVITETVVVICVVVFFTLLITGMDRVLATIFNFMLFGKSLPWQS